MSSSLEPAWGATGDSAFIDAVASESGLLAEQSQLADSTVLKLLEQSYGLKGALVRIPTEKDETFRLRDGEETYLVKLSSPDEDPAIVELQTACMEHLERTAPGLPVQRLVRSGGGDPQVLIPAGEGPNVRVLRVMRFMPGDLLANHEASAGQLQFVGSSCARLGLALQDFDHPRADRLLLWDLKHFHRMRPLLDYVDDKQKRAMAEDIFDQFDETVVPLLGTLTSQVVHGDFSPFNVIVAPSRPDYVTGIIDFGDVVRTAVIFDISVTMANLLGADPGSPMGARTSRHGWLSEHPSATRPRARSPDGVGACPPPPAGPDNAMAGKSIASTARLSAVPLKAGLGPARRHSRSPCTKNCVSHSAPD